MKMKQKIVTYIWFDSGAEEAVKFYKEVFGDDLKVGGTTPYLIDTPSNKPIGSVMIAEFELFGQKFALLNGGPYFKPTGAISFLIECEDQKEIDRYWNALSSDPNAEVCGWLKDKFGISWQIVPKEMDRMLSSKEREAAARVMQAVLGMKKIILADLESAYKGVTEKLRKAV
jgi:predicted 3-demethylubiquinone-9 3-methyltransferase (glyoxalase superfamily)